MKRSIFVISLVLFFAFCKKKDENTNQPAQQPTPTSPATANSTLNCGGAGWYNPVCSSSGSLAVKGINGATEVTLAFGSIPTTGTYSVNSTVSVTIQNAPNQPSGVLWYGKTGP